MLKKILTFGSFVLTLSSCGIQKDSNSDLDAIPRDLIACLKSAEGTKCPGYKVAARSKAADGTYRVPFEGVFETLWENYPKGKSVEVKAEIGGEVDADWIANTCVVRTSRALNAAGASYQVPSNYPGLYTVPGADKKNYALRVVEIAKYLLATYGRPTLVTPETLPFHKGIIMFDREGWSDANGHFDMWDGTSVKYSDYSSESTTIFIWESSGSDELR